MKSEADFLVEIGTEELPPRALHSLSRHFTAEIADRIGRAGLGGREPVGFATPRRLAVRVSAVLLRQPDQQVERRGPAVSAAYDSTGVPTQATLGFARSCGVEHTALARLKTDKGEWLVHRAEQHGRPAQDLLPEVVSAALGALPIPRRMRWGTGEAEFVRPVHWVVMLLGESVVPAEILGISSGRVTRGHRFMGSATLSLAAPHEYEGRLAAEGKVIACYATRREKVASLVRDAARGLSCRPVLGEALLDEVTSLVEWPAPIVGSFDSHFLGIPREALVATMQGNQKYFPLEGEGGEIRNQFITISNIESATPDLIRAGNERVIRPRLSDAAFFFDKDRQVSLASRLPALGGIVFERSLGSMLDKSMRVVRLAEALAPAFGADPAQARRVAELARCDLLTEMVGEFPELQGTMGRHYALHDGEAREVAEAIGEFYHPRFAGDAIPTSPLGRAVACADRLDTLVGIFSAGGAPTGDKDPYALRRAAIGCLRLAIEGDAALDLPASLANAAAACGGEASAQVEPVLDFILDRARSYFTERGHRTDVIESVLSTRPAEPRDLSRRIIAVEEFCRLPQASALAAANKRIANILRRQSDDLALADLSALHEAPELALSAAVAHVATAGAAHLDAGDYAPYLRALAELHEPVNAFFESVLVMAEDARLRHARLALLSRIQEMFLRVADVALINT